MLVLGVGSWETVPKSIVGVILSLLDLNGAFLQGEADTQIEAKGEEDG